MVRRVALHADDLAASHSANMAFVELFELSMCSTGSVMVPCPWFPEMAAIARQRTDLDLGVHLTLTSEMPGFRWRPLTGVAGNGLTDPDGYFWAAVPEARRADPAAVEAELRAQIDGALAAGIDVTHLDSHMGTIMMPELLDLYLRLGADYRLPILLPRNVASLAPEGTHDDAAEATYHQALERLAASGNPDFLHFVQTPWGNRGDIEDAYRRTLSTLPDGLSWAAFHYTTPGDIEAVSPDAQTRIDEYRFFVSDKGRALLDEFEIEPVGMRAFRDALRA